MALDHIQDNPFGNPNISEQEAYKKLFGDISPQAPIKPNQSNDTAGSDGTFSQRAYNWMSGNVDYLAQSAAGAAEYGYQQVITHPWETAGMVGLGVVLVAAAPVAGVLGASAAVVAGIDAAVTAGGAALATYSAVNGVSELADASTGDGANNAYNILTHPEVHSKEELEAAEQRVRDNMGPGTFDATLGLVGVAGTAATGMRMASSIGKASRPSDILPITQPKIQPEIQPPIQAPTQPQIQPEIQPQVQPEIPPKPPLDAPPPKNPEGEAPPPVKDFREPLLQSRQMADDFTNRFKALFEKWDSGQPDNPLVKTRTAIEDKITNAQSEFAQTVSEKLGVSRFLVSMRLNMKNEILMQKMLQDDPELLKKYAELKEKTTPLQQQTEEVNKQILAQKQDQVREVMDTFCKEHSLPTPEINFADTEPTTGSYSQGRITVSAENTQFPNRELVGVLGHELTHLEQDALTVRYVAQKLNIKSPASEADIAKLTEEYETNIRDYLPPDFARRALELGKDQPLSPEEIARVEKIIPSFHNYHTVPDINRWIYWNDLNSFAGKPDSTGQQLANVLNLLKPERLGPLSPEVESALTQVKNGTEGIDATKVKSLLQDYIVKRAAEERQIVEKGMALYNGNYVEIEAKAAENQIVNSLNTNLSHLLEREPDPFENLLNSMRMAISTKGNSN
jgi:hypothetical protein